MKMRMSLSELKEYCSNCGFTAITFWAENQSWYCAVDPCKVRVSFPMIQVHENPDGVYLRSGENCIGFEQVRYAEVDTDRSVLGTVITLYCNKSSPLIPERNTYTLIAR